jgi:chromosome segregation ATPase
VGQRRGGVGIIVNKSSNNDSPSRADTASARIRETTTVHNLQSRARDLRRKVVSSNEAERYWRAKVDNHKANEKSLRSQVSELERQIVEGETKRKKIQQEVARLKRKILEKHGAD